ncbi:MAG: trypsin-like peptidase domain-containing protein [Bdellovibrionales bacterium]|nr:trypsin-like peptidase domain-containing protein [Bdellovibrionales bacterium]
MKILLLILLTIPLSAYAFPEAPFDALTTPRVWTSSNVQDFDFEGIVKLSNCSGSLVRFSGQPLSSKAIVLTNGHCVKDFGLLEPGEVWHNRTYQRDMKVADASGQFYLVKANKVLYATMTYTDAALFELNETYLELEKLGVRSFELDGYHPIEGTSIEIVSGYWERGFRCNIDKFIHKLLEGRWTFNDSIKYSESGCEVYGGTSGSPIVETNTRRVVGVNNTGNERGRKCTINNPCEVDEKNNVVVDKGAGYGQQTYIFYSCLSIDFKIDLSLAGCQLPN